MSGGTLATVLSTVETMNIFDISRMSDPFLLAVPPPPKAASKRSLIQTVLGVHSVPDMGTLTTHPGRACDTAVVYRSSTLMRGLYGPRFTYCQFLNVRNALIGVALHWALIIILMLLVLPPVRWLMRMFIYAPGQGPRMEDSVNDMVEYQAVATADEDLKKPRRAIGTLNYRGSLYSFAGVLLAEAAMVILKHEDEVRKVSGGGFATPATLGQKYVDQLGRAGCHVQTRFLDD
jgi:hypothetical protein